MSVKVPYRLCRSSETRPTTALLLPGHDAAALLRVCERLRLDPLPTMFAVKDGFLLRLSAPPRESVAGLVRLGELAPNLLLPVDAALVPMYLPDEAAAMCRERGLVFLPHGRVLEFRPNDPIPLNRLLAPGVVERRAWQAPTEPPPLAERVFEIVLALPEPPPSEILDAGGEGIGVEDPRPADSSLPKKMLGKSAMGMGKGLSLLGGFLHMKALSKLGGKLMAGGMSLMPRLSESLLGKQEAGLRELLKAFRAGKIDDALRRALPLNDDMARGAGQHGGTSLPYNDANYSLNNILSQGQGAGGGGAWITGAELYNELRDEYRKQAEAATRRGDYRRAAFIYGKLLADYRMAAAALAQGGLHHDAAILYLKQLDDPLAAAREFEAAGDIDRALDLYRQRGDHIRAGDLLRRAGEDDLALVEYLRAADELVRTQGMCQAGELLLTKAERPDLAREYFEAGWRRRPEGSPVPCATRLAQMHAEDGDGAALLALSDEADGYFAPLGNDSLAAGFYNHLAQLAERPTLAASREDLHDRALIGLSQKMRQAATTTTAPAALVPSFFGAGTVWDTPLVSDAQFAIKQFRPSIARPLPIAATTICVNAEIPVVRSVAYASTSGEVFLGFASGEVACCNLTSGEVSYVTWQPGEVFSLAVSPEGNRVVLLSAHADSTVIASYLREGDYRLAELRPLEHAEGAEGYWLCPTLHENQHAFTILWDAVRQRFEMLFGIRLLNAGFFGDNGGILHGDNAFLTALIPPYDTETLLAFNGRGMRGIMVVDASQIRIPCPFPARTQRGSLAHPQVSLLGRGPNRVELAGIGEGGTLTWLDVEFFPAEKNASAVSSHSTKGPFAAVACVRAGLVAAVGADAVVWFRASESGIREQTRQAIAIPNAVACYPLQRSGELAIVGADGTITRLRQPL